MLNGYILMYIIMAIIFITLFIKVVNKYDYVPKKVENKEEILVNHPVHGLFLCVQCDHIHNNKFQCPYCLSAINFSLPKLLHSEVDFKELVRIKNEKTKTLQITEEREGEHISSS